MILAIDPSLVTDPSSLLGEKPYIAMILVLASVCTFLYFAKDKLQGQRESDVKQLRDYYETRIAQLQDEKEAILQKTLQQSYAQTATLQTALDIVKQTNRSGRTL